MTVLWRAMAPIPVPMLARCLARCMALWIALALPGLALAQAPACRDDTVHLRGDWGQARFTVELAVTAEEKARGLMHRASMPRGAGMLFVYPRPQTVAFWMKNTLIELDMIFAGPDGVVRHVHHRAQPGDLTPVHGGSRDILVVLEINGGLARALGIVPGSQLRHPALDPAQAAWPC